MSVGHTSAIQALYCQVFVFHNNTAKYSAASTKTAAHKSLLYSGFLLIHQANHYATGMG